MVAPRGAPVEPGATPGRALTPCDRRADHGPFDIIGDVHGCLEELLALLARLGYTLERSTPGGRVTWAHHPHRQAVFLGDLADRGPDTPGVLRLAVWMVGAGAALCLLGNHDAKLLRALEGRRVKPTHGLAASLSQLEEEPATFVALVREFLAGLPSHNLLDGGKLVVAHAGLREDLQGECSGRARAFALYGQTTGERDEFGLPVREDWAQEYRGQAVVVYGHTPVSEPTWVNRTINIDTGCVFGGALTALRYPEMELVSVPARRVYFQPARPLAARAD